MKNLLVFAVIATVFTTGHAYSKYGRTCRDIGCASNEVCVIQEDPCTRYSGKNCGKYPTCKRVSNAAQTCANYICPPTTTCRMDRGVPKCFEDRAATGNKRPVQSYDPHSGPGAAISPSNYPQNPGYNSNYPQHQTTPRPNVFQPGQRVIGGDYRGGVVGSGYPGQQGYPVQGGRYPGQTYPGSGHTTPRPNVFQVGQRVSGGGYQGGVIGSGYPGQGGYLTQGSKYPGQTYPGQQYPSAGQTSPRPNIFHAGQRVSGGGYRGGVVGSGYPGQGEHPGYPTQYGRYSGLSVKQPYAANTYSHGGYPTQRGGYSSQGGYYTQNRGGYGYNQAPEQVSPNPLLDKVSDTLKTWGSNFLRSIT